MRWSAPTWPRWTATSVGLMLLFALFIRPEIEMTVAPIRNPTFVILTDGSMRNAYDVRLLNKDGDDGAFLLAPSSKTGAQTEIEFEGRRGNVVPVPADTQARVRVYLTAAGHRDGHQSRRRRAAVGPGHDQRRTPPGRHHLQRNREPVTELTGRHVATLFVAGFSVIIAVHAALAVNAVRSFPGLEVPNSHIASQSLHARRDAQQALG